MLSVGTGFAQFVAQTGLCALDPLSGMLVSSFHSRLRGWVGMTVKYQLSGSRNSHVKMKKDAGSVETCHTIHIALSHLQEVNSPS